MKGIPQLNNISSPIVLMYHGILSDPSPTVPPNRGTGAELYYISLDHFKAQMKWLKDNGYSPTLFDNTKIELQTWFIAIHLITKHKRGISSLQLSKDLHITQKTAWFMLQRLRNYFGMENNYEFAITE